MVVRGVPHRIAKDAWWLDDADPPRGVRAGLLLAAMLFLADVLIWDLQAGIGIALWMCLLAGAIALAVAKTLVADRAIKAAAVLFLAVIPMVEVMQFGTFMVGLFGLFVCGVILTGQTTDTATLLRAVVRLPGYGLVQTARDAFALRVSTPSTGSLRGVLFDWALPVGIGGLFLILFAVANPLLDKWLLALTAFEPHLLPRLERVFFWGFMAVAIWPLLRLAVMIPSLTRLKPVRGHVWRSGFLNERSVLRALVVFNLVFLIQTTLDLGYLWGGVALPEGMTYAQYAHRGAYPLLVTALLAGFFALMTQPYLGAGSGMRRLLYLWIAQTIVLVFSSILRLDLYVDVYGLTRLRFAAFIWMIVVALGLVLIIMQLMGRQTIGWFLQRAFGLGILAIYLCNLVNIDGLIARHNLAVDHEDKFYLCTLGEGAVPAIRAYELQTGELICDSFRPYLTQRDDWREWGYRNARLHRSLANMEIEQ